MPLVETPSRDGIRDGANGHCLTNCRIVLIQAVFDSIVATSRRLCESFGLDQGHERCCPMPGVDGTCPNGFTANCVTAANSPPKTLTAWICPTLDVVQCPPVTTGVSGMAAWRPRRHRVRRTQERNALLQKIHAEDELEKGCAQGDRSGRFCARPLSSCFNRLGVLAAVTAALGDGRWAARIVREVRVQVCWSTAIDPRQKSSEEPPAIRLPIFGSGCGTAPKPTSEGAPAGVGRFACRWLGDPQEERAVCLA